MVTLHSQKTEGGYDGYAGTVAGWVHVDALPQGLIEKVQAVADIGNEHGGSCYSSKPFLL